MLTIKSAFYLKKLDHDFRKVGLFMYVVGVLSTKVRAKLTDITKAKISKTRHWATKAIHRDTRGEKKKCSFQFEGKLSFQQHKKAQEHMAV